MQCLFCCPQYLARKGEGRELDIELNKLGSRSLFASPGSYSFSHALPYSKGTTALCSAKGINTPPSPPLQYKIVWGTWEGARPKKPVSLSGMNPSKACESLHS